MEFHEPDVENIDITSRAGAAKLLSKLTGTRVSLSCRNAGAKADCGTCEECRNWRLMQDKLKGEKFWRQRLNEILLLAKLRPVSDGFFRFFFSSTGMASPSQLKAGVATFRGFAMLCFGNYRYAYSDMSQADERAIRTYLGDYALTVQERIDKYFSSREPCPARPHTIDASDLWLLGYIAKSVAVRDIGTAYAMAKIVAPSETLDAAIEGLDADQLGEFRERLPFLESEDRRKQWEAAFGEKTSNLTAQIDELNRKLIDTRGLGEINTSYYLALDEIDVYVATSMREPWEFEEVSDFVTSLSMHSTLKNLELRFFDPTQSYLESRIDKGLIESLMVKRAQCAIYMVQEMDTFGKDSELAAMLAQGKPVLAYLPSWETSEENFKRIKNRPVRSLENGLLRLRANDCIEEEDWRQVCDFLKEASSFYPYYRLVGNEEEEFRKNLGADLEANAHVFSRGMAKLCEGRAEQLKEKHPLALQVELQTGVANGVLLVRTPEDCAQVLKGLLTNSLKFTIEHDERVSAYVLREGVSGSPFRVVTDHETLTNSFWSFYLPGTCSPLE